MTTMHVIGREFEQLIAPPSVAYSCYIVKQTCYSRPIKGGGKERQKESTKNYGDRDSSKHGGRSK